MKVVCVVDKLGTAIDRLAKGNAEFHDNIEFVICDVHPKRPDVEQLARFKHEAEDCDVLDFQYFRTAEMLKKTFPFIKDKKQILAHHNPYSIHEQDWNDYDLIIANNLTIKKDLEGITSKPIEYIPNCVDTTFWEFGNEYPPKKDAVIMVANRIEGKKGILPVAIACGDLKVKMILVGSVSDRDYMFSIMQTGCVEFHEQISDEDLRDLYHQSTVHVCNSVDNFESGTMPMLEAMDCGVPVFTRNIGHVPELNNGENLYLYEGDNEDVVRITEELGNFIYDKKKLEDVRQAGWKSAKTRSFERRAFMYQKAYRQVLYDTAPVSIVVPVFDKPETILKCLNAVAEQTYKNIELIVVDDSDGLNRDLVRDFTTFVNFPVRYIYNFQDDYGLARARNAGTIESTGDIMVYCDQRMVMEPDAVEQFVLKLKPKTWLYGNKGGKKEFVENFSCVYRNEVINAGMFCERMDAYGGLSQELRSRLRNQGMQIEYVEVAKATPAGKSSNRNRKRQDIIRMKNRLYKMNLE